MRRLRRYTGRRLLVVLALSTVFCSWAASADDDLNTTMSQVLDSMAKASPSALDKAAVDNARDAQIATATRSAQATIASHSATGTALRPNVIAPQGCQRDLTYLDRQLPRFSDPTLADVRDKLIHQNVSDAIRELKAKGMTKAEAMKATQQNVEQVDEAASQAAQCFQDTSVGTQGAEQFWKNANRGQVQDLQCSGITSSCGCAYVTNTYASIALRQLSSQIASCWK